MTTITSELDALVQAELARWTVPGVAVGILRDGVAETKGYGVASIETEQPVTADTLFQIGSISKVFCATLVLTAVDEGKLDLDTPISAYLPEFRLADEQALAALTLRHLLSHTSGIFGDDFQDFGMGDDALAKAVANFPNLRQYSAPGEVWAYCNSGFDLAGRVVEAVLGQPYEVALRERVFAPLDLERSFLFAHEAIAYPVAVGHKQVKPGEDPIEIAREFYMARRSNPCGGVIGTVGDLLKFAQFHMGDGTANGQRVLSEASIQAMQTPQTKAANFADEWGLGWDLRYLDGVKLIEHGGSTNGYQAQLIAVPDKQFAVAVLTNGARGMAVHSAITKWALHEYCGLSTPLPEPISLNEAQLARLAGVYDNPFGKATISVHDGGLRLTLSVPEGEEGSHIPPINMRPISELECVVTEGEYAGMRTDFITFPDSDKLRWVRFGGRRADRIEEPAGA
jgi:CubicO group peptidase (beta-lactamase class C family)